jgi:hypothetical protein
MAAQWCTIQEMFDQAPELRSEGDLGVIQPSDSLRYIERATQRVKHLIQGRYLLTQFASIPDTIPTSLRTFVAVQAAILLINSRQNGEAGKVRIAELDAELLFWSTQAANGSLLADDDTLIPASQAITNGDGDTGMTLIDDLYPPGVSRYGVFNDSLSGPRPTWRGDWA